MEALTDLRFHEVEMQTHPGFFHYPTLSLAIGRVLFAPVDLASDRATGVLSRYLNGSYRMITSLAEELTHARGALAAVMAAQSPPPPPFSPVYTPHAPPSETPSSSFGPPGFPSGSRRETLAEWASLLATPAAPMLRRHAPSTPKGEPS